MFSSFSSLVVFFLEMYRKIGIEMFFFFYQLFFELQNRFLFFIPFLKLKDFLKNNSGNAHSPSCFFRRRTNVTHVHPRSTVGDESG